MFLWFSYGFPMVFLWFSLMFKNKSSRKPRFFKRTVHLRSEVALIVLLLGRGAYWLHGEFPMENPNQLMKWGTPLKHPKTSISNGKTKVDLPI